ncbi:serine hydrolase [Methyloglobulus sp.]|uniref:serine hydrolase n=1 Tax=Methyloglobulus sp. TaxID=2518622 RepID=UPI0039898756
MTIVKRILLVLTATGLMLVSQLTYGRHAALLIDADNGNVLYELEANQSWYPASLTKLMTLYMAFSALESGRLRFSDPMNVSSHAASQPTSKLGLRPWETISVEDAVLAIITRSANDAAVVFAERLAGSEQQFAIQMTSTAHSLGMYGSHFMNATGLPHDWQTTTAHDMALLALKITRNFPQYYPYFAADSLYFKGRELRGINKFVAHYPGAEGMKTGYTCGSGYNLVASANQHGKRLIGVVLGGKSSSERYQHMFAMMDAGFSDGDGPYRSKNINTMSKNSVGTPPYQLSCGHRPSSHYAAQREDDDNGQHVRYARKTSHTTHHASNNRAGKNKTAAKRVSKKQYLAKSSKNSRYASKKTYKTKVAATSRKTGKKTVQTIAKSKQSTKSGRATQVAKTGTSSKGYYTPASKSKRYYKADSSNKTIAKSIGKSKRASKRKS